MNARGRLWRAATTRGWMDGVSPELRFEKRRYNYRVSIRAPLGATPLDLLEQAKQAARLPDLLARVTSVNGGVGERAVPQWDELRIWDPGD